MAGRPLTAEAPRKQFHVLLSPAEIVEIRKVIGDRSLSAFIRELVLAAVRASEQ